MLYTAAIQEPDDKTIRTTLFYNFAFGASSVGSIRSRMSPAASLR
jgi:hypothetical protein